METEEKEVSCNVSLKISVHVPWTFGMVLLGFIISELRLSLKEQVLGDQKRSGYFQGNALSPPSACLTF